MSEPTFGRGGGEGALLDVETVPPGDGTPLRAWGTCPVCGLRARLDGEQYRGEVSVDCPNCAYHETHDHRQADGAPGVGE